LFLVYLLAASQGQITAGQIGVGIAQTPAFLLEREEGLDAGAGRASAWNVMAIESCRIAPVGDGMEVHREGVGLGKQHPSKGGHPSFEQGALVFARSPRGLGDGERLLGEDVQTGEQAQGLVEIKRVDVSTPLLVGGLERQQGQ
jgi:hypothetical protein